MNNTHITLYDTTLRDGGQTRGVDFSVKDKKTIAEWLDTLGIDYIEAGWPGANPTDTALFENLPVLQHAKFTAFGMMRRNGRDAAKDAGLQTVLNAAPHACLVGKSWDLHVTDALGMTLEQNLEAITATITEGVRRGKEIFFDAEHFFDGYKTNPAYALQCLTAAHRAGASWLVLCETNGGTLPHEISRVVAEVHTALPDAKLGIHAHNDCGCAVANSLAAVRAGCTMIQGTLNGLGERCGNANLITLIPVLHKAGYETGVSAKQMTGLTHISRALDDLLDRPSDEASPFVGRRAFAHKGGLHASAVAKSAALYEQIQPETIGNEREIVMSNQAGRASVLMQLARLGIACDDQNPRLADVVERIKKQEAAGYSYDNAAASFALLAQHTLDPTPAPFTILKFQTSTTVLFNEDQTSDIASAEVTLHINGKDITKTASGNGPVNALDLALRQALGECFPSLEDVRLSDYHVRILDTKAATAATTRVSIEMENIRTGESWRTIGISNDIVAASLEALRDGYAYKLTHLDPKNV